MILSIDFRTDIPAFYSEWLLNRFEEGYLMFRNPAAPSTVHKVILDKEHIEGIIWCSKDYRPILQRLHEITDKFPSVFHCTITPYGGDIEPGVDKNAGPESIKALSAEYGKEKVIWRYDPILLTDLYTILYHISSFKFRAYEYSKYVDRVVINFVTMYEKVKRHMPELKEMTNDEKLEILRGFLKYCKEYGLKLQTREKYGTTYYHLYPCTIRKVVYRLEPIEITTLPGCERKDIGYDTYDILDHDWKDRWP